MRAKPSQTKRKATALKRWQLRAVREAIAQAEAGDFATDAEVEAAFAKLGPRRWCEFMGALNAPPRENMRLRKLLARKPLWEK